MKTLCTICGTILLVMGIATMAGVYEMDQFTAGLHTFWFGLIALVNGIIEKRKK